MSERIAEFMNDDDAMAFRRLKGVDNYSVCGGIHMPWAVIPNIRYPVDAGQFEPNDVGSIRSYIDPDEDQ